MIRTTASCGVGAAQQRLTLCRPWQSVCLAHLSLTMTARRVATGQLSGGYGALRDPIPPLEMHPGHHLSSSVGLHSSYKTACGRLFNPQTYNEVVQASCDQKWLIAIQREMMTDKEYTDYLRQNGGVLDKARKLGRSVHTNDEFMKKLKDELQKDVGLSLSLCALQEAYQRIRRKRDEHETCVAADGERDPYASLRRSQQGGFSHNLPFLH